FRIDGHMHNSCFLIAVFVSITASAILGAEEPKKNVVPAKKESKKDYDETILEHFKYKTDTESLLAYLKAKSSADDDLLAVPKLIEQLGEKSFAARDAASKKLMALGLPAFMPLRDALDDKDSERARLAKLTIEKMERGTHTVSVPPCTIRLL